eukprot:14268710-Alexandrium_andersonii.AAC.1
MPASWSLPSPVRLSFRRGRLHRSPTGLGPGRSNCHGRAAVGTLTCCRAARSAPSGMCGGALSAAIIV